MTFGRRGIKTLSEISIVNETFNFYDVVWCSQDETCIKRSIWYTKDLGLKIYFIKETKQKQLTRVSLRSYLSFPYPTTPNSKWHIYQNLYNLFNQTNWKIIKIVKQIKIVTYSHNYNHFNKKLSLHCPRYLITAKYWMKKFCKQIFLTDWYVISAKQNFPPQLIIVHKIFGTNSSFRNFFFLKETFASTDKIFISEED